MAGAILLGFAVGVVYDLLRLFRTRVGIAAVGWVLDLLFWAVAVAALFVYSARATGGQMRI